MSIIEAKVLQHERYGKTRMNGHYLKDKPLTKCEIDVLRMIAMGETNKSMAYIRKRSIKTIEKLRTSVHHKLGLYCIADLTHYALATGICGNKFGRPR